MATLSWAGLEGVRHIEGSPASLHAMSAALHASVMAGAMERVLDMTLQYCNERQQFGRALGKFQAVQHQLSVMAEHVTAVSLAAQAAFHTAAPSPDPILAAMAKARASRAAPLIANAAHALHGAIGVTKEFDLQIFTRLLHAWRAAHGSESHWDGIVGRSLLASSQTMAVFARTCGEAHAPEAA
jgi:alkylation response protein AidB-like acyl-CoA dehydrogenase